MCEKGISHSDSRSIEHILPNLCCYKMKITVQLRLNALLKDPVLYFITKNQKRLWNALTEWPLVPVGMLWLQKCFTFFGHSMPQLVFLLNRPAIQTYNSRYRYRYAFRISGVGRPCIYTLACSVWQWEMTLVLQSRYCLFYTQES